MASSTVKDGKALSAAFIQGRSLIYPAVTVILSAEFPPDNLAFPNRRLRLTEQKPTVPVGRTSNRNNEFKGDFGNAFIDSPVMSRKHAEISADFDNSVSSLSTINSDYRILTSCNQRVFIKDVGSMHGTFVAGEKLLDKIPRAMHQGDVVTFGAPVRNPPSDIIQPTRFRVDIEFNKPRYVARTPNSCSFSVVYLLTVTVARSHRLA